MRRGRFYYSIASGSSGNCGVYVEGSTVIVIDLGVSLRKITKGLEYIGLTLQDVTAVLITHEHIDHVKGLPMFLKKAGTPVFASNGTIKALEQKGMIELGLINPMEDGKSFDIEQIGVLPFRTPHDAAESLGFKLESPDFCFGFATDLGFVPRSVKDLLRGCDAAVLESNHDPYLLQLGPYPYNLKERVSGPGGHLSNPDCAVFAADLVRHGARTIILAHLSEQNNMPELALQQVCNSLRGLPACDVRIAPKEYMDATIPLEAVEVMSCSLSG